MDLKRYVGQHVVVQFKQGVVYYLCHGTEKGEAKVVTQGGTPMVCPVLEGIVVEQGDDVVLEYKSLGNSVLHTLLNPDGILTVTVVTKAGDPAPALSVAKPGRIVIPPS